MGGNTKGVVEEIQSQTGADLLEIKLVNSYSGDYNTVLDEALSVHYSGGSSLLGDVEKWLRANGLQ